IAAFIFLLATFALVGMSSLYGPYLEILELKGYDFMMSRLRGPLPAPDDIVVIAIDQSSFDEFQSLGLSWPWPRYVHAELIRSLNKAEVRAIIFDVIFDQETDDDDDLAAAIRESRAPVVLAATEDRVDDPRFGILTKQVLPVSKLVEAGAHVGYADMTPDYDDVLRHGRLSVSGNPTVVVQACNQLTGTSLNLSELPIVRFQGKDPEILINYLGGTRHIHTVSYYQAIDHQMFLPPETLKDKIVFVGRSTAVKDVSRGAIQKDAFPSPFRLAGSSLVPGVEIHANTLNTLLSRNFIGQAPLTQTWIVMILLAALISGILLGFDSFRLKIFFSLAVMVGYEVLAALIFVYQNYWLHTAHPFVIMLSVFGLNTLYQYRLTEKERAHIRKALKGYVSSQVMSEIMKNPDSLELGGTQVEATVLFSDIAGFSKISEKTTPRKLFSMLNDYFTRIGDVIMKQEGMINKYIGDAVMAIWNAPKANENHAALACQAALEMRRIVEEMRPLEARIGINTGPMVAGNLGHIERMEYTVIGDAVNLASRLEGANKPFGTAIMISESTEELVRGQFLLRLVDRIRVIGKQQPVRVYEVLAGIDELVPDGLHQMVQSFDKIIDAYESRDWESACALIEKHLERFSEDKVARIYLERCREFSAAPPPADWDGVYALKSK
ncbi:adenylate/guanylate cyclase domain-containing protein, partial [Acidobacteria bacterium AH-259-L09]|nr:adenylate/guanylate cyclase domain-containing protein [Acidobacteria bacterium AH-259-L09]